MRDLRHGRLQAEIAAVRVDAGVVSEILGMASEAEGIVGLVEISGAQDEFSLVVALEAGAWNDVENSVGAVSELRAITAAVDFHILEIFGIELRSYVLRDGRIDDGNAVKQPRGLMAAPHVQHVVSHVGAGRVVGNHRQAVGAVGARRSGDVEAIDEGDGRRTVCGSEGLRRGDRYIFVSRCQLELKMGNGHGSRDHGNILRGLLKAGACDRDGVVAQRHGVELEVSVGVSGSGLGQV